MEIDGSDIGAVIGPGGKNTNPSKTVLKLSLKRMIKEKVYSFLQMILQKRKMQKNA